MDTNVFAERFASYVTRFMDADGTASIPVQLKIRHTDDVCRITRDIIGGEGCFSEQEALLFDVAARFHDISRFEQFVKFHTFRDDRSFDHGNRSAELMLEEHLTDGLTPEQSDIAVTAVRFHNKISLPADLDKKYLASARMIRDADKLAILEILLQFFQAPPDVQKNTAMTLELPKTQGISPCVLAQVRNHRMVPHSMLRTVDDFKLMLFVWVYDLNYPAAAAYALSHNLFPEIRSLLPANMELDIIFEETTAHLTQMRNGK